jgi:hypothetical protein
LPLLVFFHQQPTRSESPKTIKPYILNFSSPFRLDFMQQNWKRRLKNNYFVQAILTKYYFFRARKFKGKSVKTIFEEIFEKRIWHSSTSVSGSGSEWKQTAEIRKHLPILLEKYKIKTLLDLPCGDFSWMQTLNLPVGKYIGADIVEQIILQNQLKYQSDQRSFLVLDFINDKLPDADLILVRDAWVHLSDELVKASIQNLKKSQITYLLTTHFPFEKRNIDIQTGSWRPINLMKKPFNFPQPIEIIAENSTESGGQYTDKSLALWKIADLYSANF